MLASIAIFLDRFKYVVLPYKVLRLQQPLTGAAAVHARHLSDSDQPEAVFGKEDLKDGSWPISDRRSPVMFGRSPSFANSKPPAAIMSKRIRVYRNWRSTSLKDAVLLPTTPHSAKDCLPFIAESHTLRA